MFHLISQSFITTTHAHTHTHTHTHISTTTKKEWNFAAGGLNTVLVPNPYRFTEAHRKIWRQIIVHTCTHDRIARDYAFRAHVNSLHELLHLLQSPIINKTRATSVWKREYEASFGQFNFLFAVQQKFPQVVQLSVLCLYVLLFLFYVMVNVIVL